MISLEVHCHHCLLHNYFQCDDGFGSAWQFDGERAANHCNEFYCIVLLKNTLQSLQWILFSSEHCVLHFSTFTVLHCFVLHWKNHCNEFYWALCCTPLKYTVLHCIVLLWTKSLQWIPPSTVLHFSEKYSVSMYCTPLKNTLQWILLSTVCSVLHISSFTMLYSSISLLIYRISALLWKLQCFTVSYSSVHNELCT